MYIEVEKQDKSIMTYNVVPQEYTNEDGTVRYVLGISMPDTINRGFFVSLKYAGEKFVSLVDSMWNVISGLVTGDIAANKLSGPVGIYGIVPGGTVTLDSFAVTQNFEDTI